MNVILLLILLLMIIIMLLLQYSRGTNDMRPVRAEISDRCMKSRKMQYITGCKE
jgi:preprotein translocase subunit SecG